MKLYEFNASQIDKELDNVATGISSDMQPKKGLSGMGMDQQSPDGMGGGDLGGDLGGLDDQANPLNQPEGAGPGMDDTDEELTQRNLKKVDDFIIAAMKNAPYATEYQHDEASRISPFAILAMNNEQLSNLRLLVRNKINNESLSDRFGLYDDPGMKFYIDLLSYVDKTIQLRKKTHKQVDPKEPGKPKVNKMEPSKQKPGEFKKKSTVGESLTEAVKDNPYYVRLYRGDAKQIGQFSVGMTNMFGLFGQGIYLTDNVRVARDYTAKGSNQVMFRMSGRGLTKAEAIKHFIRSRLVPYTGPDGNPLPSFERNNIYMFGHDGLPSKPEERKIWVAAHKRWEKMAPQVEIRKQLDGDIIFRKKTADKPVSEFLVPKRVIEKMLDADDDIPDDVLGVMSRILTKYSDRATASEMEAFVRQNEREEQRPTFRQVWTALTGDSGLHDVRSQEEFRDAMRDLGYPGITYLGGITMGGGYKHHAYVFFDSSTVNKYRIS